MKGQLFLVADLSLKYLGVLIHHGAIKESIAQKIFNIIFPLHHATRVDSAHRKGVLKTVYNNSVFQINERPSQKRF